MRAWVRGYCSSMLLLQHATSGQALGWERRKVSDSVLSAMSTFIEEEAVEEREMDICSGEESNLDSIVEDSADEDTLYPSMSQRRGVVKYWIVILKTQDAFKRKRVNYLNDRNHSRGVRGMLQI